MFTALESTLLLGIPVAVIGYIGYHLLVNPLFSPLRVLPGPEAKGWLGFQGHLNKVLHVSSSKHAHEEFTAKYGRNVRIKGLGNWEDRLLTTDHAALAHVMNHTGDYQKPWQSRRVITRLIGEGMLAAEGQVHKRMRRVGNPAFSVQNMRALVPVVFRKAQELRDKWDDMIYTEKSLEKNAEDDFGNSPKEENMSGMKIDVCHWVSRATFDVIGLAGFDYNFSAIQHERNDLFLAYKDMFEVAVSRGGGFWDIAIIYMPWLESIFPNEKTRIVRKSQKIIYGVGRQIVQEKTKRIIEGEKNGSGYEGIDFLSLLIKSNLSTDISPEQRISEDDLLHNVNTFFFAGSDTTSLALTWTLLLLALNPVTQDRLRTELRSLFFLFPSLPSTENKEAWQPLWSELDALPFLNNVIRESLRVIPPVHSSIRVAMRDDEIPTSEAVNMRDGSVRWGVKIRKGQFVHIPVESMNCDKGVWGDDAWAFKPDRWDNLPAAVLEQPGLYNHLLSFSAGPRSCIGMRFSVIEMKTFLYTLVRNFAFRTSPDDKVYPANVVLTRPYVVGKFKEGSQCPLIVSRVEQ